MHISRRATGVLLGVGSMLAYGSAFFVPEVLPRVSALEITAGRFIVFGLVSAIALLVSRRPAALADTRVWARAVVLGLSGNVGYYLLIIIGVQETGAPLTALVVGALPVTLAVVGTRGDRRRLRPLVLPLCMTVAGLVLVNASAVLAGVERRGSIPLGIMAAFAALAAWTWFASSNARFLAAHPDINGTTWASVVGVAGLVWAIPVAGFVVLSGRITAARAPTAYIVGILALGLVASWLATVCWNRASVLLSIALAGQLVVVETIAATTYSYLFHRSWPTPVILVGLALLVGGVSIAVRRTSTDQGREPKAG